MLNPETATLLERILELTQSGQLQWNQDADGYYRAEVGIDATPVLIRRINFEAANQTGADPYFVEISLAGWSGRFAITEDSDGWRAVREILNSAFPNGWLPDPRRALAMLDLKLRR